MIGQVVAASKGDDVYSESARIHLRLLLASFHSSDNGDSNREQPSKNGLVSLLLTFRDLSRRVVGKRVNEKIKEKNDGKRYLKISIELSARKTGVGERNFTGRTKDESENNER